MLFVNGQPFTICGQAVGGANSNALPVGEFYPPEVSLRFPHVTPRDQIVPWSDLRCLLRPCAERAFFSTTIQDDADAVDGTKLAQWPMGFHREVVNKLKGRKPPAVGITRRRGCAHGDGGGSEDRYGAVSPCLRQRRGDGGDAGGPRTGGLPPC